MKIFFSSHGDPMLLDSLAGMNSIYERLKLFLASAEKVIEIASSPGGKPDPYEELLCGIRVEKGEGPLNLSLTNNRWLHLIGSSGNLDRYIKYFKFREDEGGNHHHPEYIAVEGYIARGTMSLIIEMDTERIEEIEQIC